MSSRYRQFCALARAAEIVGERWTLLIIRELLIGPKRFADLQAHLGGRSPTLLTARLNALVESGMARRVSLQHPAPAQLYELTESGRQIKPAIRELIRWGGRYLFPPVPGDAFEPDWVLLGLDAITRQTAVPDIAVGLVVTHGKKSAGFTVRGGEAGTTIVRGEGECQGTLEAPFDALLQIVGRRVALEDAIASRRARVQGSLALVRKLPDLFDFADRLH